MIQSTTQRLVRRAAAEESLCEVLDAVVTKCVYSFHHNFYKFYLHRCLHDYVLMESADFVFYSLDMLTTEESTAIIK